MAQRVDYYAVLSRAVQSLERDAYAARGAIYDREHKALLKRLISSSAPCSDADIAREEEAFREAIRRIEFPDDEVQTVRAARAEPAEAAWPASARLKARALRREITPEPVIEREPATPRERGNSPRWNGNDEDSSPKPVGGEIELQPESDEFSWEAEERKPRSLFKLAVAYVLVTALVLGAAVVGYLYVIGTIDLSWLRVQAAAPAERAILYEGGQAGQAGEPVVGKAVWRGRTEPGKSDLVVTLDAEIPEPHVVLAMTLSRVTDPGSGMSHLFELRFPAAEKPALGGVRRLSDIAMKLAAGEPGQSLIGTSINITPGQFMFGLLEVADVVRQNVERLRRQNWIDFAVVFGNGAAYTLSVEKGASGERIINDALASWGQ